MTSKFGFKLKSSLSFWLNYMKVEIHDKAE